MNTYNFVTYQQCKINHETHRPLCSHWWGLSYINVSMLPFYIKSVFILKKSWKIPVCTYFTD